MSESDREDIIEQLKNGKLEHPVVMNLDLSGADSDFCFLGVDTRTFYSTLWEQFCSDSSDSVTKDELSEFSRALLTS